MIKKACIKAMFKKHYKSTLGPQDNDNEPHPAIAHMYAVHITETMNVLQVMSEADLSKEQESSEEEDHHKEDIKEDKTNRLNRGSVL